VKAAGRALLAGAACVICSALFGGRPGDLLLLGGTGLVAAGTLAWLAVSARQAMRRERARRRQQAVLYAELKAALTAMHGEQP